jgi:hypothetical protein
MSNKVYGHRSLFLFLFRDPLRVRVMMLIDKVAYDPAIAANLMRQQVLPRPWPEASITQP